jgi:hypothetical protein
MLDSISSGSWPNAIDLTATIAFLALVVLVPAAGYVFMVLDFLAAHAFRGIPGWAREQTPRSIAALGLSLPCTEADLKQAYRQRVKLLHPDHGGDQRRFLRLQADFEEALAYLTSRARAEQAHREQPVV